MVVEVLQEKGVVNGHAGQTLKHIIVGDEDMGSVGGVAWVDYKMLDWSTLGGGGGGDGMALSDGW